MSVYKMLLENVERGVKFKIDLKSKTMKIGKMVVIEKGELINVDDVLIENKDFEDFNILCGEIDKYSWKNVVHNLYEIYKYSTPSQNYIDNSYFKAISVDNLSDAELAYGISRDLAQAMLEGYVLLGSLAKLIEWKEPENHWFWQCQDDMELIILKEWILK